MSAITTSRLGRAGRFYDATVGKKVVVAVTGVVLLGYVAGHLLGNLQVFAGPERINAYAELLHSTGAMLWGVRLLLLLAVALHIVASLQLWKLKRDARPVGYVKKVDTGGDLPSRTMVLTGPMIAAFVVYHVLHLTTGDVGPVTPGPENVYSNLVRSFQQPAIAISYIVAVTLLGFHLYHGIWSMFQTVGISHPRYTPRIKQAAAILAVVMTVGYISIPVAILAGMVR